MRQKIKMTVNCASKRCTPEHNELFCSATDKRINIRLMARCKPPRFGTKEKF